jgi:hypothetical protein
MRECLLRIEGVCSFWAVGLKGFQRDWKLKPPLFAVPPATYWPEVAKSRLKVDPDPAVASSADPPAPTVTALNTADLRASAIRPPATITQPSVPPTIAAVLSLGTGAARVSDRSESNLKCSGERFVNGKEHLRAF